jgi:predicted 3-demethylubiquinone-9 3-methyltransferase (glyoxalase superfamily)
MQKVVPCLMFVGDQCGRAAEAIDLYLSAFPGSRVISIERFGGDAGGEQGVKHARFEIAGQEVAAMDSAADHRFTFTPAISLFVECDDAAVIDAAWNTLADGGQVLMPLQSYDFSPKFGWLQDRFGVTWQLSLPLEPG